METRGVWPCVQIENLRYYYLTNPESNQRFKNDRAPTEQEIRVMTWMGIVSGVRGFAFFSHATVKNNDANDPFEIEWQKTKNVLKELHRYESLVLSIEEPKKYEMTFEPSNPLYRQFAVDGEQYIVFINAGKSEITVDINNIEEQFITKQMGLGEMTRKENNVTIVLQSLDTFILHLSDSTSSSMVLFFISLILLIL